jgi:hypothetical protein
VAIAIASLEVVDATLAARITMVALAITLMDVIVELKNH